MSRRQLAARKRSKFFYVHAYRTALKLSIFSCLLSVMLIGLIWSVYKKQPERDYYATSGIASPVQLTAILKPNDSSTPLLQADPEEVSEVKIIPD